MGGCLRLGLAVERHGFIGGGKEKIRKEEKKKKETGCGEELNAERQKHCVKFGSVVNQKFPQLSPIWVATAT
jgi:hypothetical protein